MTTCRGCWGPDASHGTTRLAMSASERSPGNQTMTFRVTSSRAPPWRISCAACTPATKCVLDATTIRAGYNAVQTHKDADAILTPTPAQRVHGPRVRPQQCLFRLIERLDLDLALGDVCGRACRLSIVHDAGRVSVLRQQEKRLEGVSWQREPGVGLERFWIPGNCLCFDGCPPNVAFTLQMGWDAACLVPCDGVR